MAIYYLKKGHLSQRGNLCVCPVPIIRRNRQNFIGRRRIYRKVGVYCDRSQNGATAPFRSMLPVARIDKPDKILTTFVFPEACCGPGDVVEIAGSFNNWEKAYRLRRVDEQDSMVRSIVLPAGLVQYKFIVDGLWRHSPRDGVTTDRNTGSINNHKVVAVNTCVTWHGSRSTKEVMISGSFVSYQELIPLTKSSDGRTFTVDCCLPYGQHFIRFLVDGQWRVSADLPRSTDDSGTVCNEITVHARDSFHIFAHTSWRGAVVRARHLDVDSQPVTELEFTIEGPDDGIDSPYGGGTYKLPAPGGYKLSTGQLRPFPQALHAPYMLVSDVDGTMIDDSQEGVDAAKDFREYWEESAALCRSILVYNTGRSVGQLTGLLEYRRSSMAVPDAMITAVGTKIWLPGRKASRANVTADSWEEDAAWARLLDEDWDLSLVRDAAGRCISDRCHWLDRGEEHPHRVALSVHAADVMAVAATIKGLAEDGGCRAQVIVSGVGDYRYLDVLAVNAGKRKATEYVRRIFGVSRDRVITAGDSGNDILMLEGDNPGIVVGNAQPVLVDWVTAQDQREGRVVLSDKPLAHGILEGLARHGLY